VDSELTIQLQFALGFLNSTISGIPSSRTVQNYREWRETENNSNGILLAFREAGE